MTIKDKDGKILRIGDIYTGGVYRTNKSIVVVLELHEEEYGNEFVEKGEQWANVMHCHTEYDMLTNVDLLVSAKAPTVDLPYDLVVQTDLYSAHSLETIGERIGDLSTDEGACLGAVWNREELKSEYHLTGQKMSKGCPLWEFKIAQGENMHTEQLIKL